MLKSNLGGEKKTRQHLRGGLGVGIKKKEVDIVCKNPGGRTVSG